MASCHIPELSLGRAPSEMQTFRREGGTSGFPLSPASIPDSLGGQLTQERETSPQLVAAGGLRPTEPVCGGGS